MLSSSRRVLSALLAATVAATLVVLVPTGPADAAASVRLVKDIFEGAESGSGSHMVVVGDSLLLRASDDTLDYELWSSDGTTGGTVLVKDINPGGDSGFPARFVTVGDKAFFAADDGTNGQELWVSDGTADGTAMVKDINPGGPESTPEYLVAMGGLVYFNANDGTHGPELWVSDGTEAGTRLVKDLEVGGVGYPSDLTVVDDTIFFGAWSGGVGQLWATDGTADGTAVVRSVTDGGPQWPGVLTAVGSTLFFRGRGADSGNELWTSDGTAAGTVMVKDINPGTSGAGISELEAMGSAVYFGATDGTTGNELWTTDGTEAGTSLVAEIRPGDEGSDPSSMLAHGDTLFFRADDGVTGAELWSSDGTAAGTVLVSDIRSGAPGSSPQELVPHGGRAFFRADDGVTGHELWATDGTDAGTVQISDIRPGANQGFPHHIRAFAGELYFTADDGTTGYELWSTISDTTSPSAPILSGTTTTDGSGTSELSWTAVTDPSTPVSYTLYTSPDAACTTRDAVAYSGTELGHVYIGTPGTAASFCVSARDADANPSAVSNTVTLTPTAPARQPDPTTEPEPDPTEPDGEPVLDCTDSSTDQFSDIDDDATHADAIGCLADTGIVTGYGSDVYGAGVALTRGQAATILTRLIAHSGLDLPRIRTSTLTDVAGRHGRAIVTLDEAGIVSGYADDTYRPGQVVSRAQLAALLVRTSAALGQPLDAHRAEFRDVDAGSTHVDAIGTADGAGIITGYTDGTFRPASSANRAQTATMFVRWAATLVR